MKQILTKQRLGFLALKRSNDGNKPLYLPEHSRRQSLVWKEKTNNLQENQLLIIYLVNWAYSNMLVNNFYRNKGFITMQISTALKLRRYGCINSGCIIIDETSFSHICSVCVVFVLHFDLFLISKQKTYDWRSKRHIACEMHPDKRKSNNKLELRNQNGVKITSSPHLHLFEYLLFSFKQRYYGAILLLISWRDQTAAHMHN